MVVYKANWWKLSLQGLVRQNDGESGTKVQNTDVHRKETSVVTSCLSLSSSSVCLFLEPLHLSLLLEAIIIIFFLFINFSPHAPAPSSGNDYGNCWLVIGLARALDRSWVLLEQSHHWLTSPHTTVVLNKIVQRVDQSSSWRDEQLSFSVSQCFKPDSIAEFYSHYCSGDAWPVPFLNIVLPDGNAAENIINILILKLHNSWRWHNKLLHSEHNTDILWVTC